MIRGDRAEDNHRSIAMKRWVDCAHYQPDVVEAFAHKVFDCLLAQVKKGFRGWHHNDYVDDDRKGEERDHKVDCAGRLDNIIDALEREKTICEDMMNSGSQIRMFVNAPVAYAARKYQNRVGNSKRKGANGADPNPRPAAKGRKNARSTRARSTTVASERAQSRDTTPHFLTSGTVGGPYYRTSISEYQPATSNPTYTNLRPHPYISLPDSSSQDFGGYVPLPTAAATPMLRQPSATPQNIAAYTPLPTIAPNPLLRHRSGTPQGFTGYAPLTTTAQSLPPNVCPASVTSQPPTTSRPTQSNSHQRRTYNPPTQLTAAKFSMPQTAHVPTPPALAPTPRTTHVPTPPPQPQLYQPSYAADPSHNVDYPSASSTAGNIWHGYAPAASNSGGAGYAQVAFPDELVDPSLLGDDGGRGGEEENDLFSQLMWAAGIQPSTPVAEEAVHQQGVQQTPQVTVCLQDLEGISAGDAGDAEAAFESFWNNQEGVQAFSFPDGEGAREVEVEMKGEPSASASASAKVVDAKGKGKRNRSDDDEEGEGSGRGKRRRE